MPTFPRQATKMGLLGGMPSLRVHVVSQSPLCSIFTVKGLKKICPPHLHVVSSNEDKGAFCDFYGPKNREIWGDQRGDQERGLETPVGYRVYYEVLGDFSCYDFLVGFICLFCFFPAPMEAPKRLVDGRGWNLILYVVRREYEMVHETRMPESHIEKWSWKKWKTYIPPQVPMVFILDDELTMMMPGEEDAGAWKAGKWGGEPKFSIPPLACSFILLYSIFFFFCSQFS